MAQVQIEFAFCREPFARPKQPKRPERLFFAVFPDPATALDVRQLGAEFERKHQLKEARLKMERYHVSLHHVGDYMRLDPKVIFAAMQAGKAVSLPPFEMTFRYIISFDGAPPINGRPRKRPLVLRGEGDALFALHAVLGAAMERYGLRPAQHFVPHMTLSYGSKPIPMQAIEPIRFVVRDFVLVHSELGLTRYNVICRWPLLAEPLYRH